MDNDWPETITGDATMVGLKLTNWETDSASFVRNVEGEFITSAPECAEKIISDHGKDCETHKTAAAYLAALEEAPCDEEGRLIEEDTPERLAWEEKRERQDDEFLQALLKDYKHMLQKEIEYRDSNEYIDESILANEYTFTADGKRFG